VIPLLRISQARQAYVLEENGVSQFLDHPTISSFAFHQLVRSGTSGVNPMVLHPLGPYLTQLVRSQITGGYSWCNVRLLEKGDRLPPRRLDPQREDGRRSEEMERTASVMSLDANGYYFCRAHNVN
jgi:hypothetical protein